MKIQFINHLGMSKTNKNLLGKVNDIIEDYSQQGYKLTLRQLYYQLVTKNVIANNVKEFDKLSNLMTKGRLLGIVDWYAIEDRTRSQYLPYYNIDPEDAIKDSHNHYRLDRQNNQGKHIELWVEKDALSNVLKRKTEYYHVHLMVNRGYSSTTAMYESYCRFLQALEKGEKVHLLYLGDHDPSGLDMVRDIFERIVRMLANQSGQLYKVVEECENIDDLLNKHYDRIEEFESRHDEEYGGTTGTYTKEDLAYVFENFEVLHIGLTTKQVELYNPPPNPAKLKRPQSKMVC
jgi:sarcosine oxidase delta subunit